jgi:ABC-type nickel/cobalt efflux system permease component RcnA/ABC-type uncharacterized transport system substrate-binding protein
MDSDVHADGPARVIRAAGIALLIVLLVAQCVRAHPDVFMESRLVFVFDGEGLERIDVELMLEQFFVERARSMADSDGDGKLSDKELRYNAMLIGVDEPMLTEMIFLWRNGQKVPVEGIAGRQVIQGAKELGVRFSIPCRIPAGDGEQSVVVSVFDECCFVRVVPAPTKSVMLRGRGPFDVTLHRPVQSDRIELDPGAPMNPAYTMSDPLEIRLDFHKRPPGATTSPAGGDDEVYSYGRIEPRSFMDHIFDAQQTLRNWLADLSANYDRTHAAGALGLMLVAAFCYGVLHAVGPGHGKSIAAAYLLGSEKSLRSALLLGNLIPLIHTASGVIVSVAIHFVVARAHGAAATRDARQTGELTSYALITMLGAMLLVLHVRAWRAGRDEHDERPHWTHRFRSPWTLALAVGIFPCPTTIIIMEMFINDAFVLGLLLVGFQAIGMAVTISIICLLVAGGRVSVLAAAGGSPRWTRRLIHFLAVLGALLVALLGVSFFYTALGRYYPDVLVSLGLR